MTFDLSKANKGDKVILSDGSHREIRKDPNVILDSHYMDIELDLGLGCVERFNKSGLAYGDFHNIVELIDASELSDTQTGSINIRDVLNERGNRYGNFEDNSETCQQIKCALGDAIYKNGYTLESYHTEALHNITQKMARIVNGDPNYRDNWVDIAGYAQLVVDLLDGEHE